METKQSFFIGGIDVTKQPLKINLIEPIPIPDEVKEIELTPEEMFSDFGVLE